MKKRGAALLFCLLLVLQLAVPVRAAGSVYFVAAEASVLDTIPYELTCAVNKRVPRVYMENGQEIERSLRLL